MNQRENLPSQLDEVAKIRQNSEFSNYSIFCYRIKTGTEFQWQGINTKLEPFEEFLFWDQVVFSSHAHLLPHPQGTAGLFHNICKPCANPHHTSHNSVSAWFHHCRLVSQPIRVRKILSTLLNFYETKLHAVSDYKDWSYKDRRWNFGEMNAEHVKINELMVWWQKI